MDFNEYQERAKETAIYPTLAFRWIYPALGLAGESGEVVEKLKKIARNKEGEISEEDRKKLGAELGDVLWYVAMLANELGLSLEKIAEDNLAKLKSRKERNVLHSEGDER
ncbi:hypothetical protein D6817_00960 [Candidatus Pacearchaeota archaeon]|nr:MAG: hypothetical protein D6817_00960 [Candidatus Pacearchaeota archaeon]